MEEKITEVTIQKIYPYHSKIVRHTVILKKVKNKIKVKDDKGKDIEKEVNSFIEVNNRR